MQISAYDLALRYVGVAEIRDKPKSHPLVSWWLSLCGFGLDAPDEIPWCSAFVNGIAWELRLPRSKSAAARSWLNVGVPVPLKEAGVGFDVVVLSRGDNPAQGHVGFFAGFELNNVLLLGGNQGDQVSVASFPRERILGVRRLA